MAVEQVLRARNITDTTAEILVTDFSEGTPIVSQSVSLKLTSSSTTVASTTTNSDGIAAFSSLTPNTEYRAEAGVGAIVFSTLVEGAAEPTTATQAQWQDLVSKVKAKANSADLATVATSGSYNDLSNKPTIPTVPTKCFYGTCSTAKGTAAKVVTCSSFTAADLVAGTRIVVLMSAANTYNGTATLNINNTGAHDIYYNGTTTNARYMWNAGESVDFIFNGSQWAMVDGALATTDYYGVTKLYNGAGSSSNAYALTPNALYAWANGAVCPYYSTSETYAVGDKVRYGNLLYKCNTAIVTAEAWTAAHWTELPTIQEQLDDKQDTLTAGNGISITNNVISADAETLIPYTTITLVPSGQNNDAGTWSAIYTFGSETETTTRTQTLVYFYIDAFMTYLNNLDWKVDNMRYDDTNAQAIVYIPKDAEVDYKFVFSDNGNYTVAEVPHANTITVNLTESGGTMTWDIDGNSTAATLTAFLTAWNQGMIAIVSDGNNILQAVIAVSSSTVTNGVCLYIPSEDDETFILTLSPGGDADVTVGPGFLSGGSSYTAGDNITISNNTIDTAATVPLIGSTVSTETSTAFVNTNGIVDGAVTPAKLAWTAIIDKIYPVGSIYMSTTLTTASAVGEVLGGTWVAWGAGRVPVGVDTSQTEFDTVEETGGEKTHQLTIAEMPSHHHTIVPRANYSGSLSARHTTAWEQCSETSQDTSSTGGNGAHNNLQPYITCYMYKRTA